MGDILARSKGAVYKSSIIKIISAILIIVATLSGFKLNIIYVVILITISNCLSSVMMLIFSIYLMKSDWKSFYQHISPNIVFGLFVLFKNILLIKTINTFISSNLLTFFIILFIDCFLFVILFIYQPAIFGRKYILFFLYILTNSPFKTKPVSYLIMHFKKAL